MKVVVLSDTHGELQRAKACLKDMMPWDACFHLGDVGFPSSQLSNVSYVCGNHDQHQFVDERIVELEGWKTWVLHGHYFEFALMEAMKEDPNLWRSWDACMEIMYDTIISMAKKKGCQLVLFGHTHTAYFKKKEGVYLCNPGSLCFSHDGRAPSYAVLTITSQEITCIHHFIQSEI